MSLSLMCLYHLRLFALCSLAWRYVPLKQQLIWKTLADMLTRNNGFSWIILILWELHLWLELLLCSGFSAQTQTTHSMHLVGNNMLQNILFSWYEKGENMKASLFCFGIAESLRPGALFLQKRPFSSKIFQCKSFYLIVRSCWVGHIWVELTLGYSEF